MTREKMLSIAKPMLFNTEMAKAILEGRKTVTRRIVKLPSYIKKQENGMYTISTEGTAYENQSMEQIEMYLKKPCKEGDILYVRETWQRAGLVDDNDQVIEDTEKFYYAAGPETPCFDYWVDEKTGEHKEHMPWRPSIHMPKEAARIFLKVKDVRVERLQEIDAIGCLQEGIESEYPHVLNGEEKRYAFSQLWNSTIKKSDIDQYGWDANPYVWVIEFERIKPDCEV